MKQFTKDGKIGFRSDWRDAVILAAQFDAVDTFCGSDGSHAGEGYELGVMKDGKWGLIHNLTGDWITPCTWEAVGCFQYGLAKVKWCGKWGFINRAGVVVTYCRWDEIEPFVCHGTVARAWRNGKANYILRDGTVMFDVNSKFKDLQFDAVETFYDPDYWYVDYGELSRGGHPGIGYEMGVLKDGKWGLINIRSEEWITPCRWESIGCFEGGLARVKQNGKWGFLNTKGELVIPCLWKEAETFRYFRKQIRVKRDGKYGYLDMDGKEILACEWDAVGKYDAKWMSVKRDGIWYVRDEKGNLFAPGEKETLFVFRQGMTLIQDDGAWGLMDREGREVIACEWDAVERLPEDVNGLPWEKDKDIYSWKSRRAYPTKLVKVRKNGKWGIYDLTGKECYPCTLDKIWRFRNGTAKICEDGKWGLIDEHGRIITPCQWQYVDDYRGEEAAVKRENHWGAIDRNGDLVRPCTYFVGL